MQTFIKAMVRRRKRLVPSCSLLRNRNLPKHHTRDDSGQLLLLQGEKSRGLQSTMVGPGDAASWTNRSLQALPTPHLPHPLGGCSISKASGTRMGLQGMACGSVHKKYGLLQSSEIVLKLKLNLWTSRTRKQRDLDKIDTFEFFSLK